MSRDVLDQIYKLYVRPHLDYGDIIYHRYGPEFKLEFTKMLEPSRYSPALAVSDAWRWTNTEKLYEELWWGILYYRRWYRRLCHFISFKIIIDLYTSTLRYHRNVLFIIICIELTYIKPMLKAPIGSLAYFQNCMREWNQLDESIKSSPTASVFKRELMRLIMCNFLHVFCIIA